MVKIGLFGAGHLGKIHLKLLKELNQRYSVVGFYDPDEHNRIKVEQDFGVKGFENPEELMDLCDAIDIVTPTISHFDIASRAIKKSKHVFIEKPITSTITEAKTLLTLSHEANVKVQVGHVERFNPAFLQAKGQLDNPMFIETHRLAQFNPRGTDVSVVLDLMIHDLDIVLATVKSTIKRVSASGVAVVSDTPDIANARIEFDNGCVANLTCSRISLKNMRKSRFFQRDAYVSVDFLDKEVNVVRMKEVKEGEENPFGVIIDLGNNKGKKELFFENPEIPSGNAIKQELDEFAVAILTDMPPPVSIEDGYNALDLAFKIIEKLKITSNIMEN